MKSSLFKGAFFTLALLAAGVLTSAHGAAMPGAVEQTAEVKVVQGNPTFTDGTGASGTVRNGQIIKVGTTINTGPGASVVLDLGDNGSALEIKPDSTLKIDTLLKEQTGAEKAITTELDLKKGSIVGNVKKLSKASTYEVKTANGVAGIRGTSFHIFAVGIFRCANGLLIVRVTEVTPGVASRTVQINVPGGREVNVGPVAQPGQPPRPTPRPVLIEAAVVVVLQTETRIIAEAIGLPVPGPTTSPLTPRQERKVEQAVAEAVQQILNAGANNTQQQITTDADRVAAYLMSHFNITSATDPRVVTANAAYARAFNSGQTPQVAAAIAIAILQTGATSLTDALFNSAVRAEVGFVPPGVLNLNNINVSPIGNGTG